MSNPNIENIPPEDAADWTLWRSGALPHLPYRVQIDFVQGRADAGDAELITEHIEECTTCASEVADLRVFVFAETSVAVASTQPESIAPPSKIETSEREKSTSFLQALRRIFSPSSGHLAWTCAVASVGFLVGGATFWVGIVAPQQRTLTQLQAELTTLKVATKPTPETEALRSALAKSSAETTVERQKYKKLAAEMAVQADQLARLSQDYESIKKQMTAQNTLPRPSVRSDTPKGRPAVLPAVLNLPDLSVLAMVPVVVTRGSQGASPAPISFPLLSPVGTKTLSVRPTLRWQPLFGASSYRVTLRSVDGETLLQSREPLTQAYWRPEELARGVVFEWQVVALDASGTKIGETPVARFAVLSGAEEKTYRAKIARYGEAGLGSIRAMAEAGLWELAEQSLEALPLTGRDAALRTRADVWREQIIAKRSRLLSAKSPLD